MAVTCVLVNRRHKTGLFLALLGTGISLLLDSTIKQTFGVLLVGLALTWLLGSLNFRTLGFVACFLVGAIGLTAAALPVLTDWESYRSEVHDYDAAIADLRLAIAHASVGDGSLDTSDDSRKSKKYDDTQLDLIQHPCAGPLAFPRTMAWRKRNQLIREVERESKSCKTVELPASLQKWATGERLDLSDPTLTTVAFPTATTNEEMFRDISTTWLVPRPSFGMKNEIASHRLTFLTGSALVTVSLLGFILLMWHARKIEKKTAIPRD